MTRRLPWGDLPYFLAVCQRGSVGAAAQALQVNHSTVLRRIASLEKTLEVRLFDRLPSGYAPTERGQELAAGLAGVDEQFSALERRITGADLGLSGLVRLTAPDSLLRSLLLQPLAAFSAQHHQLQLQLVVGDQPMNLNQRGADVAVRGSNSPPENLIGRPVGIVRTALYASRAYLQAHAQVDELGAHRWVGHAEPLAHIRSARWLSSQVAPERIVLRVDSLITLADAVAAGFGVGWLLCPLADARQDLVQLRPPDPEFDTTVWVLTHPDLKRVARVRALSEFLYQCLSQHPQLHPLRQTLD